jgi:bisphosphoglycerate-dependent phosphoglycerate mutase
MTISPAVLVTDIRSIPYLSESLLPHLKNGEKIPVCLAHSSVVTLDMKTLAESCTSL